MLLAACSGGGSPSTGAGLPSAGMSQNAYRSDLAASGIAPKFLRELGRARPASHRVQPSIQNFLPRQVFVSDTGTGAVEQLKHSNWSLLGSITSGLNGPDGNWVGKNPGDLYVANYAGPYVTEYDWATGNLNYTYSTGLADPVDVTTDRANNVYVADFNYTVPGGGFINEYAHQSNTVIATCSPGGNVEGVAVDSRGDVFASYNVTQANAAIIEYPHGLIASGCNGTVLPITLSTYAGGMAFDRNNNLVVCDQLTPAVDVIAPPYTSVTGTLGSGYTVPFHVTIDMANNQAYVADYGAAVVQVLTYPGGASVATLGSANGLTTPVSAVDSKNFAR